jgi:plastocyanin
MKDLTILLLLAGMTLMVGCAHTTTCSARDPIAAGPADPRSNFEVAMLEFHFQPESLNLAVGDTVTWVNHGHLPHTTTSGVNGKPDGRWDSGYLERGHSFSYVFTGPGTYRYYCMPHWRLGMKGVIVVTAR